MESFGVIFLEKEKEIGIDRDFITYPKKETRMCTIEFMVIPSITL